MQGACLRAAPNRIRMNLSVSPLNLTKRFPLTISRGTSAGSENLLVHVDHDGVAGIGEAAPFYVGHGGEGPDILLSHLENWQPLLLDVAPWEMQKIEAILDRTVEAFAKGEQAV